MKFKYSKFTGEELDELDLEELLSQLSDLLLSSGFDDPYELPGDERRPFAAGAARCHSRGAAQRRPAVGRDARKAARPATGSDRDDAEARLDELIQQIIDKLQSQGYVTPRPAATASGRAPASGGPGQPDPPVNFEITDKSLDFLGYRALRDLLGSIGKSSLGRHDTREMATGVEASGAPKPYEFGDTLNLDPSGTILNAVMRTTAHPGPAAAGGGIDVDYEDLMVAQGEYQSSCATVLMLDCSHSMILYGEDRFTPAKRVALALANLIRLQYPGDALKVVLFHDSAEEIPLTQLARVRVGPYYTNTREGLRLARRILERQQKDMRQIVMITDGKPSALTRPDGRIYRNAFGLDPFIVSETFAEVAACRKAGILINTFMLARDHDLVSFVRQVAEICHGKAYFTTPHTLGQYVLMDYMDKKTRTIH